jgi:hypothetical protein
MQDTSSALTLDNVRVNLLDDYQFSNGSLKVLGDVALTGTQAFIYSTSMGSTIDRDSCLAIESGMTFSYDPSYARKDGLYFVDETARLALSQSTLKVTTTGMSLTRGTLQLRGVNTLSSDAGNRLEAFEIGDGTAAGDLNIEKLDGGAKLIASSGIVIYKNTDG